MRRFSLGAWWLFAAVLTVGFLISTVVGRMLVGGTLMALAFLLAAALRWSLPEQRVGGLNIRSRRADLILLIGFGVLVLGATLAVDLGPVRR